MNYPEVLRARTTLLWFTGVLAALVLLDLLMVMSSSALHAQVHVEGGPVGRVPVSAFISVIGFIVGILASVLGASVNRYREYGETVMTFPVSRRTFATSVLATDIAALAIAFAITIALGAVQFTVNNVWRVVAFDDQLLQRIALCLGAVVMWFALCQAVSAWLPHRAGYIAGLSWPVFIGLTSFAGGIANMPPWSRPLIEALNFLNPLAYLSINVSGPDHAVHSMLGQGIGVQTIVVWLVSLVALAVAVAGWQRQEL
jgi:hypothetical protein